MKRWADNGVLSSYDAKTGALIISSDGQMNNVDHRDDFPLDGTKVPLVTASNRSNNSISIYKIDVATRRLESVAAGVIDRRKLSSSLGTVRTTSR